MKKLSKQTRKAAVEMVCVREMSMAAFTLGLNGSERKPGKGTLGSYSL